MKHTSELLREMITPHSEAFLPTRNNLFFTLSAYLMGTVGILHLTTAAVAGITIIMYTADILLSIIMYEEVTKGMSKSQRVENIDIADVVMINTNVYGIYLTTDTDYRNIMTPLLSPLLKVFPIKVDIYGELTYITIGFIFAYIA